MFQRRIPTWLRHSPHPSVQSFAVLAGTEAAARAILISVFPIAMYRSFEDAAPVSRIFFLIGLLSMIWGFLVPSLIRVISRRWLFSIGASLFILSAILIGVSGTKFISIALGLNMVATVTVFVCFNAYVLDNVASADLGKCETLRLFFSATSWTVGPAAGVWLYQFWEPAPFILSGGFATLLLAIFWWLRLGNGKLIAKAKRPPPNPIAYLGRFFSQRRLVAGWMFAVIRSCGWWVYVVYVPVFALENGLGETVGGTVLSITNGLLFATPLMLKFVERTSVRNAVRLGFLFSGLAFLAAGLSDHRPEITIAFLMFGTIFLLLLDICAGLPFLMAVKPSERTEMSAVYASFRDVSAIISPGVAWLTLLIAPISGLFVVTGVGLILTFKLAGYVNPRLGRRKPSREIVVVKPQEG